MENFSRKKYKIKKSAAFFYKKEVGKLLTEANIDFVNSKLDSALKKLKKVIQCAPTCHQAYFSIGLIYEEKNEFKKAFEFFKLCSNLKKTDHDLLQKLYLYSKDLNKKEDTLYFLEKMQDKSKLDEMLKLAVDLQINDKIQEYQIEKFSDFSAQFILSLNMKNLKKVILKIFNQFIEQYHNNKLTRDFFDEVIMKLFNNQEYDFLFEIFTKLNSLDISLKNQLIFAISLENTKNFLLYNNTDFYKKFPYDSALESLYLQLGEYNMNVLEYLSEINDLNIKKIALKKLAEKSETCLKHDEYHKCNLYYYLKYLDCAFDDNQIRLIVSSIYQEQGELELTKQYTDLSTISFTSFESTIQFFKKVKDKKILRYTQKDCAEMRKIYNQTVKMRENFLNLSKEEIEMYFNINSQLLNDFFNNLYIFPSNLGHFKNYLTKNERTENQCDIIFRSLHGLYTNEWFDIVQMNFHMLIQSMDSNAFKIAFRSLDALIFKENDIIFDLVFLIMKYCIIHNNLDILSKMLKKLFHFNDTFFYLYHFVLNFFVDYPNNFEYRKVYVNLRRIYLRNYDKNGIIIDNFLYLTTYVPFFLYPETLDKIDKIYDNKEKSCAETILLAIIFFNNSRSRRISNRNYYIQKGFNLLKSVDTNNDNGLKYYNLGRAYQHFGLNGFAEMYYRKCFDTEYADYAKFNLIVIYKKNGSIDLIKEIYKTK